MKFYQLPISYSGKLYLFNKVFGILLTKNDSNNAELTKTRLPKHILGQYQAILNPYMIEPIDYSIDNARVSFFAKFYGKMLVFTCKYSFLGTRLLAKLPIVRYYSTKEAIAAFKKIYPTEMHQRTLCLPRTFFAVATSKSFNKKGVAFIGAFLPSRKMHAWIIEDNSNPDPYDDAWICYKPVVAIAKKA